MGAIITQNIDGLHTNAGATNVIELHGTVNINYCMKCHKSYSLEYVKQSKGVPKCSCGGIVRPHVVLYGENLHDGILEKCIRALNNTNLLIVLGTSLAVSTAQSVFRMFRGKDIVMINNEATIYDDVCSLVIKDDLIKVFKNLSINK
jgi:NAD-dependent deacetylase